MNLRDSTRELTDQENSNIVGLTDRASKTNYADPGTRKNSSWTPTSYAALRQFIFPHGMLVEYIWKLEHRILCELLSSDSASYDADGVTDCSR